MSDSGSDLAFCHYLLTACPENPWAAHVARQQEDTRNERRMRDETPLLSEA